MTSIRRRLLALLLGGFALSWTVLAVVSYRSAQHEIEELFDAQLAQSALVLHSLMRHEFEEGEAKEIPAAIPPESLGHRYVSKIAFQIWRGPNLLLRTPGVPEFPIASAMGYTDQSLNGQSWRIYGFEDRTLNARIFVGELYQVRDELIYKIALGTLLPALLMLPLLGVVVWGGVARGMAPLKRVADEIKGRSPAQLEAIPTHDVPVEIAPLTMSLNHLLGRVELALDSERRFTANAAHELRTPLAGLKAQAQVALRAGDNHERAQALQQIVRGVDRATRLVEQLLTLARLDPETADEHYRAVDLGEIATRVLTELAPQALANDIDIGLAEPSRGMVRGDTEALAILIRNVIGNAIRYTPAHGHIEVAVVNDNRSVRLTVADSGPGIPAEERERVFERFYRLPQSTGAAGSGLGLSIVRRIAQLHDAEIRLEPAAETGGLKVTVDFVPAT